MTDSHLNITLQFVKEQWEMDLRIPLQLTLQELILLTRQSYELPLAKERYYAKIDRNQQLMMPLDFLANAPLQNGDKLTVFQEEL